MAKIPPEALQGFTICDEDTAAVLRVFDEPPGGRVLEVGAHDEPVANILSRSGYKVWGVDLREYNPGDDVLDKGQAPPPCNYSYLRADFCDLPLSFLQEHWAGFDAAVTISAVEHFGLGTYGEGARHAYYDVIALRTIWSLLKPGGSCYLTVPFGARHLNVVPHWRVYSVQSLAERLVQDFKVEYLEAFVAGDCEIDGRKLKARDPLTWEEACRFPGDPPHLSIVLKMRKVPCKRIAPDRR